MSEEHAVTFEILVDYVDERLSPAEAERVAAHLRTGCPSCTEDVAWLRRTLGLMAADQLISAPPELVRSVQELYKPRRPTPIGAMAVALAAVRRLRKLARLRRGRLRYALIALVCALLLAGSWWAWGNMTVAQAATLSGFSGPVEVRLPGGGEWQAPTEGMRLPAGSAVRSGEGGAAVILYPDGSHTALTATAQVEIVQVNGQRNGGASAVHLSLIAGHSEHELAREKSSLRVEARGTTASSREGSFEVSVQNETVELQARHGAVEVEVAGSTTHIQAGKRGRVEKGKVHIDTPETDADPPAASRQPAGRGSDSRGNGRANPESKQGGNGPKDKPQSKEVGSGVKDNPKGEQRGNGPKDDPKDEKRGNGPKDKSQGEQRGNGPKGKSQDEQRENAPKDDPEDEKRGNGPKDKSQGEQRGNGPKDDPKDEQRENGPKDKSQDEQRDNGPKDKSQDEQRDNGAKDKSQDEQRDNGPKDKSQDEQRGNGPKDKSQGEQRGNGPKDDPKDEQRGNGPKGDGSGPAQGKGQGQSKGKGRGSGR